MIPFLMMLTAGAAADTPREPVPLGPEDVRAQRWADGLAISPDGRTVVWEEWRWGDERRNSDLWQATFSSSGAKGPPQRLTFTPHSETRATWSPDGRWLYFQQAPEGAKPQVWRRDPATGAQQPLSALPDGIRDWALAPAGDVLYVVTEETESAPDALATLRRAHPGPDYVERTPARSTLHAIDLRSWRRTPVHTGGHTILALAPSPDGRFMALLTAPDRPLIHHEGYSDLVVVDLHDQTAVTAPDASFRDEAPSPYGWLHELTWSADSTRVAFMVSFDGHPAAAQVATVAEDGGLTVAALPRDGDWSMLGGSFQFRGDSSELCFTASDHAAIQVRCQDVDAPLPSRLLTPGARTVWRATFTGRSLVTVEGDANSTPEVTLVRLPDRGGPHPVLSDLNPQLRDRVLPSVKTFIWTAPDGVEVEGVLELPPGWTEADGPLPTVIHLHGGPTWSTHAARRIDSGGRGVFASRGWALLSPNYRGSLGYGDTFLTDLVGRENDIEVADILAGVDALVAAGIADPAELAVMGWSNGGYLTNCLIATTDRFKAASSGAGVFDQTLQWATEDTPGHVVNYMEGLPWEQPAEVQSASPLFTADRIVTPTLIHVGENDPRVPAAHALALHRALDFYLGVPSELLVYPNEGHGLSQWQHRAAKMAWDTAWFDLHVRGIPVGDPDPDMEPIDDVE